jgi:hypothetical protein
MSKFAAYLVAFSPLAWWFCNHRPIKTRGRGWLRPTTATDAETRAESKFPIAPFKKVSRHLQRAG